MMSERWWCSVFGIADGYEEVIDQDHPRPPRLWQCRQAICGDTIQCQEPANIADGHATEAPP